MRRAIGGILQLICCLVLLAASVPISATEAICLSGQPSAPCRTAGHENTCSMPCCAPQSRVAHGCCQQKVAQGPRARRASQKGCDCVLRVKAAVSPSVAIHGRTKRNLVIVATILPGVPLEPDGLGLRNVEPAIYFSDSSPPAQVPFVPDLGRAPPIR
jgi:hypothetical protein